MSMIARHLAIALAACCAASAADEAPRGGDRGPAGSVASERFTEMRDKQVAAKPEIMRRQRELLERRYDLSGNVDPEAKMSRGKPVPLGPTARLADGVTFEMLAEMAPDEVRAAGTFPYPPLPHPLHPSGGGMVFPPSQLEAQPQLARFDVEFDLPDAYLPEFPPALFLTTRPDLGDVTQGKVISAENFTALLQPILTPFQYEGLRLMVERNPQQQFNLTEERASETPSRGVSCLDCHVNGHTTGQFHLTPDVRPQEERFRLDTTSLRGVNNQQIFGSKRNLRSLEDFTEVENNTAYFDGDIVMAEQKGARHFQRRELVAMAAFQNIIAFPPAPKLSVTGDLIPALATEAEMRGQAVFRGKGRCIDCHPGPFFIDDRSHDLRVERFHDHRPIGPIKTFTLRGLKDSPPYLHDGRLLTIEDTVEFFNLVLETRLSADERRDLATYLKTL
ncbi:MAG TPA: cytochrome B6 [Planctomycetota bacterium]|nr:cytochrome B6 [Planctomycetota bacterium]